MKTEGRACGESALMKVKAGVFGESGGALRTRRAAGAAAARTAKR
jgi:hypothetical protein